MTRNDKRRIFQPRSKDIEINRVRPYLFPHGPRSLAHRVGAVDEQSPCVALLGRLLVDRTGLEREPVLPAGGVGVVAAAGVEQEGEAEAAAGRVVVDV